jgi:hypothetical protein
VEERRQRLRLLMGRNVGRDETDTVKIVMFGCRSGERDVPAMDGIKSATEESNVHELE